MAYGTKFALEFSDVKGNLKKVEILQDGYSGEVFPLVGTGSPVEITWEGDDDFYEPIIGSTCTLNLLVTDSTNYDDFYRADEREYKVKISYGQTFSDYYTNRVANDGGVVESVDCIANLFRTDFTVASAFEVRIEEDGGILEAFDCIDSAFAGSSRVGVYADYWTGWLVNDEFSEALISPPYEISLMAIDGLGTLDNYNLTLPSYGASPYPKNIVKIAESLNNLDLGFDIYVSNDLRTDNSLTYTSNKTIYEDIFIDESLLFIEDYNIRDCKNYIQTILRATNARIFQSFGRWYILNNSSYSEQTIKDQSNAIAQTGSLPTGIRDSETAYLKLTEKEIVKFEVYNSSGTWQSTLNNDVLIQAPNELLPLDQSLTREFLRGVNKVQSSLKLSNIAGQGIYGNNCSFEYGSNSWTLSNTSVVSNEISLQGNNSLKFNSTSGTAEMNVGFLFSPNDSAEVEVNYFVDAPGQTSFVNFVFNIEIKKIIGATTSYYNMRTNAWITSYFQNSFTYTDINDLNTWLSESASIKVVDASFGGYLRVKIGGYSQSGITNLNGVYADNIIVKKITSKPVDAIADLTRNSGNYSGIYENEIEWQINGYLPSFYKIQKTFRSRDDYSTFKKPIWQLTTQQIMNDFREFVTRYEGTLYNNNSIPMALQNKVWMNFGEENLQEPVSCYVDSMTYNVKNNQYEVVLHVPNQDDDVSATNLFLYTSN